MKTTDEALHTAGFLVKDLRELYTDSPGLLNLLVFDLLQDAVKIQARLLAISSQLTEEA